MRARGSMRGLVHPFRPAGVASNVVRKGAQQLRGVHPCSSLCLESPILRRALMDAALCWRLL
eukprot:2475975-Alexandrium_andersonii.AAC.1